MTSTAKTFGETDIIVLGAGCVGLTAARALVDSIQSSYQDLLLINTAAARLSREGRIEASSRR